MKKQASPAFQFYAADFLVDENVALMNNQELGCYTRLLCYCWREKSIPADMEKIARLCHEDADTMAQLWRAIGICFDQSSTQPDRLVHPRLDSEREKQETFRKERSESGARGAAARWGKAPSPADAGANGKGTKQAKAPDGPSSSSSSSNNKNKGAKPKKAKVQKPMPAIPDWMPMDAWNGYLEMRTKIKKVPTARAVELLIGKLTKMREASIDIVAVLDASTISEWTDIYPPKAEKNTAPWRQTPELIAAKAAELQMKIQPGETSWELARRIDQKLIGSDVKVGAPTGRLPLPVDHIYDESKNKSNLSEEEKRKRSEELKKSLKKTGATSD